MIGTNFGSYRIDDKLGQGGMGVVYKAFDLTLQRVVALKTIQAAQTGKLSDSEQRFMREARAASRLQHPAIVTIYHFGVEGNTQYIVMEFVEGKSLRHVIHDQPMSLEQFYDIAIQLAEGLATAHEKGVVHRDMKADNVMVTSKGLVKILDFGLAKLKEELAQGDDAETIFQTQSGVALGTVSHMSPEQALGEEVDGKTDVFSLGVVLYHMATGVTPFTGPSGAVTLARIIEANPKPPRLLNPQLPDGLNDLVLKCLQKERANRPSAAELVQALKALRDSFRIPSGVVLGAAAGVIGPHDSGGTPSPTPPFTRVGALQTPPGFQEMTSASGGRTVAMPAAVAVREESAPLAPAKVAPAKPSPAYVPLRVMRTLVSLVLLATVALLLIHMLSGAIPEIQRLLSQIKSYGQVKTTLNAIVVEAHKIVSFNTRWKRWDFMLALFAAVVLIGRAILVGALRKIEYRLNPVASFERPTHRL